MDFTMMLFRFLTGHEHEGDCTLRYPKAGTSDLMARSLKELRT